MQHAVKEMAGHTRNALGAVGGPQAASRRDRRRARAGDAPAAAGVPSLFAPSPPPPQRSQTALVGDKMGKKAHACSHNLHRGTQPAHQLSALRQARRRLRPCTAIYDGGGTLAAASAARTRPLPRLMRSFSASISPALSAWGGGGGKGGGWGLHKRAHCGRRAPKGGRRGDPKQGCRSARAAAAPSAVPCPAGPRRSPRPPPLRGCAGRRRRCRRSGSRPTCARWWPVWRAGGGGVTRQRKHVAHCVVGAVQAAPSPLVRVRK